MAANFTEFKKTKLYAAMVSSGNYGGDSDIEDAYNEMRDRIEDGEDPEEVLHDEGFEPDYFYDLLTL
jgi:hypothetical protein